MEISAEEFEAKCLELIDKVAISRESLVITKGGKPVAKVVPITEEAPASMFGYMKGTVTILGDIVDVPHEPWAAETGEENVRSEIAGAHAPAEGNSNPILVSTHVLERTRGNIP